MSEQLGEALLVLRTDDRGLDQGIANARPKAEALGRTLDATSGSAVNLGKAMDGAGASATRFGAVQQKSTELTNAQRAGINQLFMQTNDMATMWSLGARPGQIFASQIGQITQAVQLASGGTGKFAAFMGSPWTMAISTAAVVLVPLVSNLLDSEDAANKAGSANETLAQKLDRQRHSLKEVIAAVRDYNAEQAKARETALDMAKAVAIAAEQDLRHALAIRERLKAMLEMDQAQVKAGPTGLGGQGQYGAAVSSYLTSGRFEDNAREIERLRKDAAESNANLADELAKLDADPTKKTQERFANLRKEARATIKDVDALRARLAELYKQEEAALQASRKSARGSGGGSAAQAASVGDMTALLKTLFPGVQITSTTGGKHTKGSDHYAGRAIDFVPAGGMGQYSTADVERMLEEAGVTIRRNARGTKQLFGPGRSAKKPGDHNDHFHVAWTGGASPEEAARRSAQAAEKEARAREQEARRVERYTRDLAGLENAAADLRMRMAETAEEQYQLERQALDIAIEEQKRQIAANADYTDAEKAKLLAALEIKAGLERQLLDRRRAEELARQQLEIAQATWANERDLLDKQLQLSEVRAERRAIEQKILDESYKQHKAALEATIASTTASEAAKADARDQLAKLGQNKALDQELLNRNYESPIQRYLRDLKTFGTEVRDEFEKAAIGGLETLEDRLAQTKLSLKDLGATFKAVANQILADLIRIALRQHVTTPLAGLLFGSLGAAAGAATGGGSASAATMAGGAGLGTPGGTGLGMVLGNIVVPSAGFFAKGGLIPDGQFGIVGEAGPEPVIGTSKGAMVLPNSSLRGMMSGGRERPGSIHVTVSGARGNAEIEAMVRAGVRQGIASYDQVVGDRVQDHLARRG